LYRAGACRILFKLAVQLQKKHKFPVACFGHAGDGNIHVNIMVDYNQPQATGRSREALDELFRQVLSWGGAISGEHGIGIAKKTWWPLQLLRKFADCTGRIKNAVDPHGILNPGKFI
jgi:glycolate oxidase